MDQSLIAHKQLHLTSQMKTQVERYFQSLKVLQDDVVHLLGDWSTSQSELARKCEETITQRATELDQCSLNLYAPLENGKREHNTTMPTFLETQAKEMLRTQKCLE